MTLNEVAQQFVITQGILSLSRNPVEPLMWSHYSGGHTGLCIGLDEEKLESDEILHRNHVYYLGNPPYKEIFIDLVDELHKIVRPWDNIKTDPKVADDFYTKQLEKLFLANWFTKSEKWKYEEEYRIVMRHPGLYSFRKPIVTEIIFGIKTEQKQKDFIVGLLKNNKMNRVKLFNAVQNPNSFEFSTEPYSTD